MARYPFYSINGRGDGFFGQCITRIDPKSCYYLSRTAPYRLHICVGGQERCFFFLELVWFGKILLFFVELVWFGKNSFYLVV